MKSPLLFALVAGLVTLVLGVTNLVRAIQWSDAANPPFTLYAGTKAALYLAASLVLLVGFVYGFVVERIRPDQKLDALPGPVVLVLGVGLCALGLWGLFESDLAGFDAAIAGVTLWLGYYVLSRGFALDAR